MTPVFNHQKLQVYQKALACCAELETLAEPWDSMHAIADHLPRAAEGVVLNIAEASAAHTGAKMPLLDAGMGSVLECAACLDLAVIKGLCELEGARRRKVELRDCFRMLVGLKRSWEAGAVRETEATPYGADGASEIHGPVFLHEKLDVYRTALDVVRWAHDCSAVQGLAKRRFRDFDVMLTSIVLNIAEGNGRFSSDDHCRFVETAHRAAIKVSAQLDLWTQQGGMRSEDAEKASWLLVRIVSMTGALVERLRA